MKQLTIKGFQKYRPPITLDRVAQYMLTIEPEDPPGNRYIRLAQDLAVHVAPMEVDKNDTVRSILGVDIPDSKINQVKTFKQITKKRIIIHTPQGPRIIKVIRRRKK